MYSLAILLLRRTSLYAAMLFQKCHFGFKLAQELTQTPEATILQFYQLLYKAQLTNSLDQHFILERIVKRYMFELEWACGFVNNPSFSLCRHLCLVEKDTGRRAAASPLIVTPLWDRRAQ